VGILTTSPYLEKALALVRQLGHLLTGSIKSLTLLVSCLLHLESPQPLFKRILAMGGSPLLVKPVPPPFAESIYAAVVGKLGLAEKAPEERIQALKNATIEDLLSATAQLPLLPSVDGELITAPATFSRWSFQDKTLPGTEWCESIMIGDCEMDVSIARSQ